MTVTINGSNTPTAGGVTYGDGTQYATTAAGTSGQALLSAGSSAPTWGTPASATTATNLAGGGAGQIPYNTGSGTTAFLAAGTTGQALISNGTSAPSWGSAGAMSLVSTVTASNAATIQWTGLTANRYQIILENINNNGSAFYMQFGYGATPTWITTGYYFVGITTNANNVGGSGSVSNTNFNTANTTGFYTVYYMNNGGNSNIAVINITGCTNGVSQTYTSAGQSYTGTSTWFYNNFSGAIVNANNVTAIRFISASGNVSGVASLYTISQ